MKLTDCKATEKVKKLEEAGSELQELTFKATGVSARMRLPSAELNVFHAFGFRTLMPDRRWRKKGRAKCTCNWIGSNFEVAMSTPHTPYKKEVLIFSGGRRHSNSTS